MNIVICIIAFLVGYGLGSFVDDCGGMKGILKFLWQLPQLLLGVIVWLFLSRDADVKFIYLNEKKTVWYGIEHYPWKLKSGLSLACFIFVPKDADDKMILHEFGHSKQSLYLGWLYLLIIGIPSFIWACLYKIPAINKRWNYYDFYTEKWADKLGGVKK